MVVEINRKFTKQYHKAPLEIQLSFQNRLQIFKEDPFAPILQNHSLKGEWQGHCSINVTGDWRAIYYHIDEQRVVFRAIGTHSQLYNK